MGLGNRDITPDALGPEVVGNLHITRHAVSYTHLYGAATEKEVEMARLICEVVPSIEMVRMVNSGTEAVMSAVRVARGYTGRNKIVKFMGCYHGHSDAMLVKAGSGVMTSGIPDSAGVPSGCTQDTDVYKRQETSVCFSKWYTVEKMGRKRVGKRRKDSSHNKRKRCGAKN